MIEKLKPAFKDYLWGGTKLRDIYKKNSDLDRLAESWELSVHPDGESVISGGEYDGLKLSEYINKRGKNVLGKNCERFENFPVLIKFIDAKQPLSIQVHPSDEYALEVEHEYGKTEMWYVMDCDEGASLYFGVNRDVSKEEFKAMIENDTVLDVLNKVDVHKGDVFFIEAGTIHAIGAGIMICEIQQNSNTTYRVYDYSRRDDNGNLRELHVDKALEVSNFTPSNTTDNQGAEKDITGGKIKELASCEYFKTELYKIDSEIDINVDDSSFVSLIAITGNVIVKGKENEIELNMGESIFIPANEGNVKIIGSAEIIKTTIPAL